MKPINIEDNEANKEANVDVKSNMNNDDNLTGMSIIDKIR